jgi:hypothetical protein
MSKRKENTPQDPRKGRLAEALRLNLKRRRLQARNRAASGEHVEPEAGLPASSEKQER